MGPAALPSGWGGRVLSASGRPPAGAGGGMQEESSPRWGSQTSRCSHLVPSDLRLLKQPSFATPSFQGPLNPVVTRSECHPLLKRVRVLAAQAWSTFAAPWTGSLPGSSVRGILQSRTLECSHSLLEGIFLTQGSNPGLLHCRQILYHLSHQGSPPSSITIP